MDENRKLENNIQLFNQENIWTFVKRNKLQIHWNIRSEHQQVNRDKWKSKKSVPQKTKKTSWNEIQQKSNPRNKYLSHNTRIIQDDFCWTRNGLRHNDQRTTKLIRINKALYTDDIIDETYLTRKGKKNNSIDTSADKRR